MPDLKINGKTYAGVTKVQIPLAGGSGNAVFVQEGTVINGTLLYTPENDMTVKDIVAAHPIPRKYEKSLVWIKIAGDNVSTHGSDTTNWLFVYCDNSEIGSIESQKRFAVIMYVNGLKSPNSLPMSTTSYVRNPSYIVLASDGSITGLNVDTYVAAGNSVSYLEIPFDYDNFLLNPLS